LLFFIYTFFKSRYIQDIFALLFLKVDFLKVDFLKVDFLKVDFLKVDIYMPKKTRKVKRRSYKKKSASSRKHSTIRNRKHKKYNALARGPISDNVNCCMCNKEIRKEDGLIPAKCLEKYGAIRGHRICQKCWFDKFAKEGVNHSCPGCINHLPLNGPPHDKSVIVDLTEDD